MKIKDLSKIELPREKLERYGRQKLSDHELLALLLGSGIKGVNVLELSKKILKIVQDLGAGKVTVQDLLQVKGLGQAKASQIIAVLELTERLGKDIKTEILSALDVWKLCVDIRESKREHFVAFYLDTQNCLIERQIISIGILNASLVHPREVFEPALRLSAATVIVAHNHPSGATDASTEDNEVTRRLKEAGILLGIALVDHVIVTCKEYRSCM